MLTISTVELSTGSNHQILAEPRPRKPRATKPRSKADGKKKQLSEETVEDSDSDEAEEDDDLDDEDDADEPTDDEKDGDKEKVTDPREGVYSEDNMELLETMDGWNAEKRAGTHSFPGGKSLYSDRGR